MVANLQAANKIARNGSVVDRTQSAFLSLVLASSPGYCFAILVTQFRKIFRDFNQLNMMVHGQNSCTVY